MEELMEKPIKSMKVTKSSEKIQSVKTPSKLKSGSGKVAQKCKYCGKKFTTYACWVKRGSAKFCSRECHYKFKSEEGNQIRICPQCGKKFKTIKSSEKTYCSSKCAGKAARMGTVNICEICKKEYYVPPSRKKRRKYCSRECADIGRRNKVKLTCANCGVEFQVSSSLKKQKFCSKKCQYDYMEGEKHPRYVKKIKKICEFCGEKYIVVPSNKNSKYCSRKCQSKAQIGKYTGKKSPVYSRVKKVCPVCHKEFTVKLSQTVRSKDNCCSRECTDRWTVLSGKLSDEKNPAWRGGYAKDNLAMFETYAHRMEFAEQVRKSPIDKNILQVKCTYCGRWYSPKLGSLTNRVAYLEGKSENESRLYCSNRCKKSCPIYRQKLFPRGYRETTSREVQPELRQMRLALDDYTCQRCQKTIDEAELHCHHITGVEQNPLESADLDNCITLCKKCHKWAHTQKGCRYFELTCK
jgi:5-methylcytosine-specific restriction endonuclease McrA